MQENIEKIHRPPYARHDFEPIVAAVHPSSELFACAGGTVVDVRAIADGSTKQAAPLEDSVTCMSFSPDGGTLLLGGHDARVQALDAATLTPRAKTPAMYEAVQDLAWLGSGHFAAASARGEVNVYELATMRLVHRAVPPELEYGELGGIEATPDGSHLFLACGQKLSCFETRSWQPVWSIVRPQNDYDVGAIALAPDSSWLVMGTREGLTFYEARTGRRGATFRWNCAESVAWPGNEYAQWRPKPIFSRDGSFVLVNDRVGNLVRIDARRLACAEQAPRQTGLAWITELHLIGDGRRLLVVGTDNSAAVWQLEPFAGLMHARAVDPLPESAYERLYGGGDDDFDDEDDYEDDLDDEDDFEDEHPR